MKWKWIAETGIDLAGFAGAGLLAYGAWLVYAPAGFLVGGTLLLGGACMAAFSRRS